MNESDSSGQRYTIDDVARRVGHLRWLELALFEVLGEAVTETPDASEKLAAALRSRRAGERAEQLGAVIPLINGLDVEARTNASGFDASESNGEAIVAELRAMPAPEHLDAARRRLVPLIVEGYEALLDGTGPVADAPVRRVVRGCRADVEESGKSTR